MNSTIKLLTWNVRGLNTPRKIRQVFASLDRLEVQIALLLETHLTKSSAEKIGVRWAATRVASSYSTYSRGVLILVKKGVPFRALRSEVDESGRVALLYGQLGGSNVLLVNVYGPNTDDPAFFSDLWHRISAFPSAHIIWGGDFNVCLDVTLDRVGSDMMHLKQAAEVILGLLDTGQIHDIWRSGNPDGLESTFISSVHGSWSRIDYWLVSEIVCTWAVSVSHVPRMLSDHSPVLLTLHIPHY